MRFRYTFQSSFSQLVAFMHLIQVCHLAVFKPQLFQFFVINRTQTSKCNLLFYILHIFYYLLYYKDLNILCINVILIQFGYMMKSISRIIYIYHSCIMQIIFQKLHIPHCYIHFKTWFDFVDVTSFSSYHVSRYWTSSNSRFYQT